MSTPWIIGYAIGAAVVVIVATLAIILILQTRKIGQQALGIIAALEQDEANTAALWSVADVNNQLERTLDSAKTARRVAGG